MKLFVVCALLGVLAFPAVLQTKKPPAKDTTKTPAKTTSKTPAKGASAAAKPRPKPAATPVRKQPDDKAEWTRVTTIEDRTERIAALEKFIAAFPKSTHIDDAKGLIAAARVEAGNDDLAATNVDAAVTEYKAAIAIVPAPVVEGFWESGLSRIPANVYFRNKREDAIAIAKTLEEKAGTNAVQLLSLAQFYLTIEDGAEAARIANAVIATDQTSAAAYKALGFAERMEFRLDQSAVALAKASELDPDSLDAKQALADTKRSLGKPDEALPVYEAIIAKDPENVAARTGHVLALFESDRASDAETEMAKLLEDKPNNFLVLGQAAYWYAAHKNGAKAVDLAQKAIAIEPRFIWSYIALARGQMLQGEIADAEKTLLGARRYGRFPTIEYELATTRLAGGFFREAAEGLSASFVVKDGAVTTSLGGRVPRESKSFVDLVADERRASIFAPVAADDPETSDRLVSLLEFQQALASAEPDEKVIADAADQFTKGGDPMQVHRQLYAASILLEKKLALKKAAEIAQAAVANVDAGLTVPSVSTAVMASELYVPRTDAALKGEYVNVPPVEASTLSAIVRGRIEDILGWTSYQNGATDDAVVHLRRAVGVLPSNSAWWRTTTWHLGAALASSGKDTEALDMYIKSYRTSRPDAIRYSVIEALYLKVNGSTDGLANKIGENPAEATRLPVPGEPNPTPRPTPAPTPDLVSAIPMASPSPSPTLVATPEATPSPVETTTPTPIAIATPSPSPEVNPTPTPSPEAIAIPTLPLPSPTATPEATPNATPETTATPSPTPEPSPSAAPTPTPSATPDAASQAKPRDMFPPVVITVPSAKDEKTAPANAEAAATPTPVERCSLTVSTDTLRLNRGGSQAVIIGREDNGDITDLEAVGIPEVGIRREPVVGVASRALFVVKAITIKAGLYQVTFRLPCGSRTIDVSIH